MSPCAGWAPPVLSRWTPPGISALHPRTFTVPIALHIEHANGQLTHYHSAITPVIVSPGHSQVVPLRPEFITPQDGHIKQDCEIAAAKRWLAAHAQRYSTWQRYFAGRRSLRSSNPSVGKCCCTAFIFSLPANPTPHTYLSKWVQALEPGRDLHALKSRVKGKGNRWEHHDYLWANERAFDGRG